MADTELQRLIIYVGTTAQIEAAIQAGIITENDLAMSTDTPDFQEKLTDVQMNAVNSGITTQLVSLYSGHVANTTIHVTAQDKTNWNNKQNALSNGSGIDITNNTISVNFNDVATATQGAKADTALQPNDNISQLNNNAGYISYSATFYWGE